MSSYDIARPPAEYVSPRNGCEFLHRHECAGRTCDGSKDVANDSDPFADPGPAAGAADGEPGPWFVAGFDSECSRGSVCAGISEDDTIRADGEGGWECRDCVEADQDNAESAENEYQAGIR